MNEQETPTVDPEAETTLTKHQLRSQLPSGFEKRTATEDGAIHIQRLSYSITTSLPDKRAQLPRCGCGNTLARGRSECRVCISLSRAKTAALNYCACGNNKEADADTCKSCLKKLKQRMRADHDKRYVQKVAVPSLADKLFAQAKLDAANEPDDVFYTECYGCQTELPRRWTEPACPVCMPVLKKLELFARMSNTDKFKFDERQARIEEKETLRKKKEELALETDASAPL